METCKVTNIYRMQKILNFCSLEVTMLMYRYNK